MEFDKKLISYLDTMEMSMDIEFSTLEPNGLLIWQGDDTNFFAVVGEPKNLSSFQPSAHFLIFLFSQTMGAGSHF